MAAWKKLHEWQEAGVWEKFHALILQELETQGKLDWERAMVDSSSVRATQGGDDTGPNPTDRAKPGTKHHALTEGHGLPLAVKVTGANRNDITQLKPLVEAIPKLKSRGKGRKRQKRPKKLLADRGYDSQPHREWLEGKSIIPKKVSSPNWPSAIPSMAVDWEKSAGPSNGCLLGSMMTGKSAFATRGAPIFTRDSSPLPLHSFVSRLFKAFI